jgi:hypothetical protein
MNVTSLTIDHWNKNFDEKEYGTVEEVSGLDGIVWNRPDHGLPALSEGDVPEHIALARFMMFARIIQAMKKDGELSYVTIGQPPEWVRCDIYLNNQKCDFVIAADALFGMVEHYAKDQNGKLITSKERGDFERTQISGNVKIVVNKNAKTFF